MNKVDVRPPNMTRVLLVSNEGRNLSFGFYKDGMIKEDGGSRWNQIWEYEGWESVAYVKMKLDIPS